LIGPIVESNVPTKRLRIVAGIATARRKDVLSQMLGWLSQQSRVPDCLIVCRTASEDVDESALKGFEETILINSDRAGLTPQRNQIIARSDDADIIVFFDDDFFPERDYLKNLELLFLENPDIVAATGVLLADGAQGPGISVEQGHEMARNLEPRAAGGRIDDNYGTYGCNMSFRLAPILKKNILFDENLPLYGWQEDIDFSVQLAPFGRIVKSDLLRGIHLGIKMGRTSGLRFGYSQISNPVYLIRKGTMSWQHARKLMWRNLAANLVRSLRPEPWIDRRGRLRGNLLALSDLATGRISPARILHLD
jgi:GT2 family glycosyltransferase